MVARVATQERQAAVQSSVSIRQMPWYDISILVTILRFAKGTEEPAPCLLMLCAAWTCVLGKQGSLMLVKSMACTS